jgi:hypothetical protein
LVDFDGDGRLDLITGSNNADQAAFHVFRRKKDGSCAARQRIEVTPRNTVQTLQQPGFVTAADWDGDGVPDLLMRGGNRILVAFGQFRENGPIALTHELDFKPMGFVMDFAVADWDRDGKPDLLVRKFRTARARMESTGTETSVEPACPNWPRGSSSWR